MNKIINTFSLITDKFITEIHLRQPGFKYNVCGPLTKNKVRLKKFRETEDSWHIYQSKLDKACFKHDMTVGDFKDLIKEEQLVIKYYVIKPLILVKIQNRMDIKVNLSQ